MSTKEILRSSLSSMSEQQIKELSVEQLSDCLFFFREKNTEDIDNQLGFVVDAFLEKSDFETCCCSFNASEFHHVPQPSSKAMDIFIQSDRYWELLCLLKGNRLDGFFYFPSKNNIITLWKSGKKLAIWFSLMYGPSYLYNLPEDLKKQLFAIGLSPLTEEESDFLCAFAKNGDVKAKFEQLMAK